MSSNYDQEEMWRKDPNNWKFGVFYFNEEDKRIIVSKRIPMFGITFNFAHKESHYYLIGILLFFGFVIFTITYFGK